MITCAVLPANEPSEHTEKKVTEDVIKEGSEKGEGRG